MMIARALTATLLLLPLTACEKTPTPTQPPPSNDSGAVPSTDSGAVAPADEGGDDAAGDTEPGAPGVAWHDKSFQQKKEWMGIEVFPKMKTAFQGYDAAEFKKFTCDTCHGEDGKEKGYKLPNDSIYPLNAKDPVKGAMDYDEKVTKFMLDDVVPQMLELLEGETPASADNPNGISCMTCHPAE